MPRVNGQPTEAEEQTALFTWAGYHKSLEWMFAVPNGGTRNAREAKNLKRQGVKAGVSDIFVPVPRGGYHGLFIEMKVGKNKPSEKQIEFLNHVISCGYVGAICYGFEEAKKVIEDYMKL